MALNERQKKFCNEYLIDLNATQAAIRAGYSKRTARSIAQENLTKPDIQKFIQECQKKLQEKTGITQERVLQEYARIAFANPTNLYDEVGNLIEIHQLNEDQAAVIAGIDVLNEWGKDVKGNKEITGQTKRIKLWNKNAALDSLAKHLGLFEKDNAQKKTEIDLTKATITFK